MSKSFNLRPGVFELVEALKKSKVKLGVATSTSKDNVMKLFSLFILFSYLSFSSSESWKDCWGLDYLYYDEDCCTESSYLADPNFHCLDKIPALKNYSALQLKLHEQIDNLTSCKEVQQVCNYLCLRCYCSDIVSWLEGAWYLACMYACMGAAIIDRHICADQ